MSFDSDLTGLHWSPSRHRTDNRGPQFFLLGERDWARSHNQVGIVHCLVELFCILHPLSIMLGHLEFKMASNDSSDFDELSRKPDIFDKKTLFCGRSGKIRTLY